MQGHCCPMVVTGKTFSTVDQPLPVGSRAMAGTPRVNRASEPAGRAGTVHLGRVQVSAQWPFFK
jgi:hypothetical protein